MKDSGDMKLCRHVDSSIKCMTESIVWSFIQTKSKQTDNEVIFFIFRILNERKENGIFLVNHTGWRQIFVNMSTWPLRRYWQLSFGRFIQTEFKQTEDGMNFYWHWENKVEVISHQWQRLSTWNVGNMLTEQWKSNWRWLFGLSSKPNPNKLIMRSIFSSFNIWRK